MQNLGLYQEVSPSRTDSNKSVNTQHEQKNLKKPRKSLGIMKDFKDLEKYIEENFLKGDLITPKKCGLFLNDRALFYRWIGKCKNIVKINNQIYKL